ncbi:MAG: hypothetical protein RIT02_2509 [Planctomycetota bacterium]
MFRAPGGRCRFRLRVLSDNVQWPHHFVVFVIEDVAVPDVIAFHIEEGFDDGDIPGVADDGILASGFVWFRWQHGDGRGSGVCHGGHICHSATGDPSNDFEGDEVQVDGVSIHGEVMDFPRFTGAQFWRFGGGVHPAHGHGHIHLHGLIELHGSEHTHDGAVESRAGGGSDLVKGHFAGEG